MLNCEFDRDEHIYRDAEGRVYPSVTQVLRDEKFFDYNNNSVDAMVKGGYVHDMIKMDNDGTLDEDTLDPVLKGYHNSWKRFIRESWFHPVEWEIPMTHDTAMYAGTPDVWGIFSADSTVCLIDIKTGNAAPWHGIQLGGYKELMNSNGIFIRKGFILYLRENNSYSLVEVHDISYSRRIFMSALDCYRWRKENTKWT